MSRRSISRYLAVPLLALLAACGSTIEGVATVEVLGGARSVPVGATAVLTATVTAGSGTDTTVTWTSSDTTVASVDAAGVLTALTLGTTTVTATSTADGSRSDSVSVTVVPQPGTRHMALNLGDLPVPVLGVSLLMFTEESMVGPASVTEVEEGIFLGPVSPVGDDGTVNLVFPSGDELPADLLHPVTNLISSLDLLAPGCELTVGTPGVTVTQVGLPLMMPNVVLLLAEMVIVGSVTDTPIDYDSTDDADYYSHGVIMFVHADGATSVGTGEDCDVPGGATVSVDVDLVPGWNQVAWHFDWDAVTEEVTGVTLVNDTTESPVINQLSFGE